MSDYQTLQDDASSGSFVSDIEMKSSMEKHHEQLLGLCKKLEAIADTLPSNINSQDMLIVAKQIFPAVKRAHEFEEKQVFPFLEKTASASPQLTKSLERLRFEHWEDESFAQELHDAMVGCVNGDKPNLPDVLSYMLRGFFEGMRRHIAFEVEHIKPLLDRPQMSA